MKKGMAACDELLHMSQRRISGCYIIGQGRPSYIGFLAVTGIRLRPSLMGIRFVLRPPGVTA